MSLAPIDHVFSQGLLKKGTEHSLNLHLLKIHIRGGGLRLHPGAENILGISKGGFESPYYVFDNLSVVSIYIEVLDYFFSRCRCIL